MALSCPHKYFERIQCLIKRGGKRDDDRRGCVFVANVVLHNETRARPSLFGSFRRVELDDHDIATTNLHLLELRSVTKIVVGFLGNASHLAVEVLMLLGSRTISSGQLIPSDRFFDDDLSRFFADFDLVATADIELLAECLWERYLAALANTPFFCFAHTYSYRIHIQKPADQQVTQQGLLTRLVETMTESTAEFIDSFRPERVFVSEQRRATFHDGSISLGLTTTEDGIDKSCTDECLHRPQREPVFSDQYEHIPIRYVEQAEQKGLAHAILQAEPEIDGDFLVLNGDNVLGCSLDPVIKSHDSPTVDATLLVEETTPEVARTTGVVSTTDDGTVTDITEKPDDPPSTLVTTGVYVLPESIFAHCRDIPPSDRGEYELVDAITRLRTNGGVIQAVERDGWRVNVNTPADRDRAARKMGE